MPTPSPRRPAADSALRAWILALALPLAAAPVFAQLSTAGSLLLQQGVGGVPGAADGVEHFGHALAAGDFDGDGRDDLAIGAPGEGGTDTGFVFLAWGTGTGLDVDAAKGINFSQSFVQGTNAADDNFGSVLAAKDLEHLPTADGPDELAIGVPAKDVGADADAGMVYVTRKLDPAWVFADGFESNGTAVWTTTVP